MGINHKWWNDGAASKFCPICPEGFVAGRIMRNMKQIKRG